MVLKYFATVRQPSDVRCLRPSRRK